MHQCFFVAICLGKKLLRCGVPTRASKKSEINRLSILRKEGRQHEHSLLLSYSLVPSLPRSLTDMCVAVCCSVLQCVAVCCSVLQCVAVCCSVLQCVSLTDIHAPVHLISD